MENFKKDFIDAVCESSVNWDSAAEAAKQCLAILKKAGLEVKSDSSNGVKVKCSNGAVGSLVFDPQNKF